MKSVEEPESDFQYDMYAVAFVDVLGQNDAIAQMPEPDADHAEILERLRATAGRVRLVRHCFGTFLNAATAPLPSPAVRPEIREFWSQVQRHRLKIRWFADTVVIALPLGNNDDHCGPVHDLWVLLFGLAGIFLNLLAAERVVRGGFDIGPALEMDDGEVYGAPLASAYRLESRGAEYPRLLVGRSVLEYLQHVQRNPSTSLRAKAARSLAAECQSMLATDADGGLVVDYLGPWWDRVQKPFDADVVKKAYQFVCREHLRFKRDGDSKHAERYERLRAFFEARLEHWKIATVAA